MVYLINQSTLTVYCIIMLAWKTQIMLVVAIQLVFLAIISFKLMVIILQVLQLLSKIQPVQETLIYR
ncbi:hypothetical protein DUB99_22625 [Salmonella enterica subsp. enterica serovar Bonariensis]|nr:hypothetical protein [Salmonella enterica subsp. enterica serovar Bonariensis]EBY0067590.1 hypothetical protein [Salmonella enterica subsp. enterica serovar Bonariensis]